MKPPSATGRLGAAFTQTITARARNRQREEIHERSAEVVNGIYRLTKISLVHAMTNDAVSRALESAHGLLSDFSASVGRPVSITYAYQAVFVSGELLRASRSVYEAALELGRMLARCGVAEVRFAETVSSEDLRAFVELFLRSLRGEGGGALLREANLARIEVSELEPGMGAGYGVGRDLPLAERSLRAYASTIIAVREFYSSMAKGANVLPHAIKRAVQQLVALVEESQSSLLALTTLTHALRDDAVRAVHAGILALVVGRQLTSDRDLLSRLAMAAILADAGRAQVVGPEGQDRLVQLSDESEEAIPGHAAAVAFVTGGLNRSSAIRTVAAFETTWLERQELLGPPYRGQQEPLLVSQLLRMTRRLVDLVAPRDISRALSPHDALNALSQESWLEPGLFRVVVAALGFFPVGTVLELTGGQWGVVAGPSESAERPYMPKIRLLTDQRGRTLPEPVDVDLGATRIHGRQVGIARVVSPAESGFNVSSALFE